MKIGVVGSGKIVPTFLEAIEQVSDVKAVSIYARNSESRENIKNEFNILYSYDTYEKMLNDDNTDCIYIGLPNDLHYQYALEALNNNKNVIVEKPFTISLSQSKDLYDIAIKKGLYIFEAISNKYNPVYLKINELIKNLGNIKMVSLNYSQYSSRYDNFKKGIIEPAFDYKKYGGAIMDLGVYNIHIIVGLFGKPKSFSYSPNIQKGIDTSGVLVLDYGEFKAISISAKDSASKCLLSIQGDNGYITSFDPPNDLKSFTYNINCEKEETFNFELHENRLVYEIESFRDIINEKDYNFMENVLKNSLEVVNILEKSFSKILD